MERDELAFAGLARHADMIAAGEARLVALAAQLEGVLDWVAHRPAVAA